MINGNVIASKIIGQLKARPIVTRTLVAILVGDDAASLSFIKQKEKIAGEVGVSFELIRISSDLDQADLESAIKQICARPDVGGVILQLPLPSHYDRAQVISRIIPSKDVDNLTGKSSVLQPAAGAVEMILKETSADISKMNAVVIGSGLLIGAPAAKLLREKAKSLVVMNKGEFDPVKVLAADLVVTGTGVPNLINGSHIKEGAIVIDFGYGKSNGVLTGDIDFESVSKKTEYATLTPGGTGPVVVAMLMHNFFELNS